MPMQVAPTHEAWVEAVAARVAARLAQYAHARETAGLPPENESGHRESAGRLVADELERLARAELAAGRPTPEEAALGAPQRAPKPDVPWSAGGRGGLPRPVGHASCRDGNIV
ncbi:hypothetical protein [Streptomyces sp. SBT349]|uniref:hypothetical protein n=1 Tax=Streptomyces sp. SBT349 TaxID=1580539 RepID=UPI00131E7B42|nr:hypothetical protein [Streptomyces sp. SBT349]